MRRLVVPVVVVVAALVRLLPLRSGGLLFWGRYDDGVYYTASASLLDGRLPYRDFVLLHPPLITLVLLPFTLLGRLTTDPTGLAVARLAWMTIGVATAVLVACFAGRWGPLAGLAGGLWFACSDGASYAAQTTFIEPVADAALFGAVVLLTCDRERPRRELLGGVLLGIALTGKIWYVVPVGAVLLTLLLSGYRRRAARTGAAAAVTAAAILLPFFASAPRQMWHMVVFDQLTRHRPSRVIVLARLGTALGWRQTGLPPRATDVVVLASTFVVVLALVVCLGDRQARLVGVVALSCTVVLLSSPVVFHHYGDFPAASVAATVAIGWSILGPRLLRRVRLRRLGVPLAVGTLAAIIAAIIAAGGAVAARPVGRVFPAAQVEASLPRGCITADDPTALVLADRLSSNLGAGCYVAVDVTGASYGSAERRAQNLSYLDWLQDYLHSGAAMILSRRVHDGLPHGVGPALGSTAFADGAVHVIVPHQTRPS